MACQSFTPKIADCLELVAIMFLFYVFIIKETMGF